MEWWLLPYPPFNSNRDDTVIFRDESGKTSDAQVSRA